MLHYNFKKIPIMWTAGFSTTTLLSYQTQPETSHMRLTYIKIEKVAGQSNKFNCSIGMEEAGKDAFYSELSNQLGFFQSFSVKPEEIHLFNVFSHIQFKNQNANGIKAILNTVGAAVPFGDDLNTLYSFINLPIVTAVHNKSLVL